MSKKILALAVTLVFFIVQLSSAQTASMLINFGNIVDAVPTFGGQWNEISDTGDNQSLVDADGNSTGVKLSFGGDGFTASTFDQGNWTHGDLDWVAADATNEYFFNNVGNTSTIVFDGLEANGTYQIDHLPARNAGIDRVAHYNIGTDGSGNPNYGDSNPNGFGFDANINGYDDGDYLTWNSVQADASGQLALTVTVINGFGYATATRLTGTFPVPEPTGALVFSVLGIVTILRRRKS